MVGQFLTLWRIKNTRRRELVNLPVRRVSDFFVHVLGYQFQTWYIHLIGKSKHRVRVSLQSAHSDVLYSQTWVKVFFLHLWPQQLYGAFRFGTHTEQVSWTVLIFIMAGQFFSPWWPQVLRRGISAELRATGKFSMLFIHALRYGLEIWFTHPVGGTTHQVWVSSQSDLSASGEFSRLVLKYC